MLEYYEKDNIQLFLGDCIEILEKAAPESVDMIFADPPYMLSNGGITCQAGKVVSVNKGEWDKSKGRMLHCKLYYYHESYFLMVTRVLQITEKIKLYKI